MHSCVTSSPTSGTYSSCLTKDWFDDSSSSEGEASMTRRVRLRKMIGVKKKGRTTNSKIDVKKKGRTTTNSNVSGGILVASAKRSRGGRVNPKKVDGDALLLVDVKVSTQMTDHGSEIATVMLKARVRACEFKCGGRRAGGRQERKRKGKRKVVNWREHPVRCGLFQRTIPGELPHEIISRQRRERGMFRGGVFRKRHSLSLPSHAQVANVIAKCLPLHSVQSFLDVVSDCCQRPHRKREMTTPPPPSAQKRRRKKKGGQRCNHATVQSPQLPVLVGQQSAACSPSRPPPPLGDNEEEVICKTPVLWIDHALRRTFGEEYVLLKRCQHPDEMLAGVETQSDLDLVVMDCILSRVPLNCERTVDGSDAREAPVPLCLFDDVTDGVNMEIQNRDGSAFHNGRKGDDGFYRACVVIVPHAGVFYCHRERRSELTGVPNTHVPMDINWLRLQPWDSHGNCFGSGSYVQRLANAADKCSVWKWSVRRSASNMLPIPNAISGGMAPRSRMRVVHRTHQVTDEEGPVLPPDFVVGDNEVLLEAEQKRSTFLDAFSRSRSARRGCRHYAPGFLHDGNAIDPLKTFVIDPRQYGELDLECGVTIPPSDGGLPFRRHSVVQIRFLPHIVGSGCEELLTDITSHCQRVRDEKKGVGARAGNGDLGAMYPIGSRIERDWKPYVTSSSVESTGVLLKAVRAAATLASVTIPAALRVIQDFENDSGMCHVPGMDGGTLRVSHSLDLSINLANSSHFDVNDASQGFTIWTEDFPGSTKNWYFVLPNMRGKFPGTDREYNGIAIKLSHGVLIGWDGRLIRHGTSKCSSQVGDVYGNFFAAKTKIIKYGMSQSQLQLPRKAL